MATLETPAPIGESDFVNRWHYVGKGSTDKPSRRAPKDSVDNINTNVPINASSNVNNLITINPPQASSPASSPASAKTSAQTSTQTSAKTTGNKRVPSQPKPLPVDSKSPSGQLGQDVVTQGVGTQGGTRNPHAPKRPPFRGTASGRPIPAAPAAPCPSCPKQTQGQQIDLGNGNGNGTGNVGNGLGNVGNGIGNGIGNAVINNSETPAQQSSNSDNFPLPNVSLTLPPIPNTSFNNKPISFGPKASFHSPLAAFSQPSSTLRVSPNPNARRGQKKEKRERKDDFSSADSSQGDNTDTSLPVVPVETSRGLCPASFCGYW